MEKEGGNRERMRKCRESISLHFLIFSPFPPHFLILSPFPRSPAARLQRFVQPCPFNMCSVHKYNANTNTNKQQQQHHCLCLQSFLLLHWDRNHTSVSSGLIPPWQHVRLSNLQLHEIVSRRSRVVSSKMVTVSGKIGIGIDLQSPYALLCKIWKSKLGQTLTF